MKNRKQSELLDKTVRMRQTLSGRDLDGEEILGLFLRTRIADNFVYDGRLGGFVKHGKRIIKKKFY